MIQIREHLTRLFIIRFLFEAHNADNTSDHNHHQDGDNKNKSGASDPGGAAK